MSQPNHKVYLIILILMLIINLSVGTNVFAYRPFVSTDAAVAGPQEMEIEFGYFGFKRKEGENIYIFPHFIFNYGLRDRIEGIGEFKVEYSNTEDTQIVDSALSIKAVLKNGFLQGKTGPSVAIETSLLLPSTLQGERRFGFEGVGIVSVRASSLTLHFNIGGGIDREASNPFLVWGIIWEVLVHPRWRVVGEFNGESGRDRPNDISGLLGVIWQSPYPKLFFDAGIRRGISPHAPDWAATAGLTVGFPLPAHHH